MNAQQFQLGVIGNARKSIQLGEMTISEVITILECAKLDFYMDARKHAEYKIVQAPEGLVKVEFKPGT